MALYNKETIAFLDPEGRRAVLSDFDSQIVTLVPLMCAAIHEKGFAESRKHAHLLRGSCLALGADELGNLCRTAEAEADDGRFADPGRLCADLEDCAVRTRAAIAGAED